MTLRRLTVLVSVLALVAAGVPAHGIDINVSNGGTDTASCGPVGMECKTIQKGIDQADGCPNPDKVLVADGTYDTAASESFPITLKDCVSVIGNTADPTMVIVDADAANHVFEASGPLTKSTIAGMTIKPGVITSGGSPVSSGTGIFFDSLSNFDAVTAVIEKNRFMGGRDGVHINNNDDFSNAVNVSPVIRTNLFTQLNGDAVDLTVSSGGPGQMLAPEIASNTMSSLGSTGVYLFARDCEGTFAPLISKNVITGTNDGILLSFTSMEVEGGGAALVIAAPLIDANTLMMADGDGIEFVWTSQTDGDVTNGLIKIEPTITGNTVKTVDGHAIEVSISDFSDSSAVSDLVLLIDGTITGNNVMTAFDGGVFFAVYGDMEDFESGVLSVKATISENMVSGVGGTGIAVALTSWTDEMESVNINADLTINDNTVMDGDARGIDVVLSNWTDMDSAQVAVGGTISGNTVMDNGTSSSHHGIRLQISAWSSVATDGGSLAPILFAIADNTVTGNAGAGIVAEALDISGAIDFEFNVMLTNNTVTGNLGESSGIDLRFTGDGAAGSAMLNDNTITGNDGAGVFVDLISTGSVAGGPVKVALRNNIIKGNLDAVKIKAGDGVLTATNYEIDLGGGYKGGPGGNIIQASATITGGHCTSGFFCDIDNDGPNDVWAECNQFTSPNLITEEDWLHDFDDDSNLGQITDTFCVVTCTTNAECDDGVFCNGNEICDTGSGECLPGTAVDCDDSVPCTDDMCNEGTNMCDNTPVNANCNDGATCTADVCDPNDMSADLNGCVITPSNAACDDSATCTTADVCDPDDPGADGTTGCVYTADDSVCDDSNACTDDTCDPTDGSANATTGCVNSNNTDPCTDDGLFCTGTETCGGGTCNSSGNPCTVDDDCNTSTCSEITHCFKPAGTACTDDGNICTDDECDGLGMCAHPPGPLQCTACDDGNGSTHNDHCFDGVCAGNMGPTSFAANVTRFSVLGVDATSVQFNGGSPTTVVGDACSLGATIGKNSSLGGKLIATRKSGTAAQFLGGGSVATGIFTGGGSISKGVPPVTSPIFDTSNGPEVSSCKKAASTVAGVAKTIADPAAACTTNPLANIVIPLGGSDTINVTAGQLNIIRLTNLDVGMNAVLTIDANLSDPTTSVVINVDGIMRVRRAGKIIAGMGLTPRQVLINVAGVGGTATIDRDAMVEATILGSDRDISVGNMAVIRGGVWGGKSTIGVSPGALIDNKTFNKQLP